MSSQIHKVTRNATLLILGQVCVLGFNAVSIVLLARYLGETLFGVFSYGLVYIGFFGLLADFGMKPIMVREMARNRSHADSIVNNAVMVKFVLAGIAIFTGCMGAWVFFDGMQLRAVVVLSFVILLSSKSGTVRLAFESLFHADMEMHYPVGFQLMDSLLQVLGVTVLIFMKASFTILLLGYVLANVPGLIWTVTATRRKMSLQSRLRRDVSPIVGDKSNFPPLAASGIGDQHGYSAACGSGGVHFRAERRIVQWLLKESFPLFLYLILAMLYERLDVLFLKSFYGESAVGVYSSAFRLTAPLVFIPYAVVTALYPLMTKAEDDQDKMLSRLFGFGLKLLLVIGVAMNVVGLLIGKPAFLLLFGDRYAGAVLPFQLLLWSQSIMFLIFFIVDYNNARNRQSKNTLYMAVMLFFSFFLQRFFIKSFGVVGAGWAKIILNTTGLAVIFFIVRKVLGKEQRRHFYKTASVLLAFLVPACGLLILNVPTWLTGLVLGMLMLVAVFWLFSKEEKQLMKTVLQNIMARWGWSGGALSG